MPGQSDVPQGNIKNSFILQITNSFTIVNTVTYAEQTVAIPGLLVSDAVQVAKSTFQAGLLITGATVRTNGVLSVAFGNPTGSNITPTANDTYQIEVNRPSNPNNIPSALV